MMCKDKCEECGKHAACVGLGKKPRWLCLDCFDKALGETFAPLHRLMAQLESEVTPDD